LNGEKNHHHFHKFLKEPLVPRNPKTGALMPTSRFATPLPAACLSVCLLSACSGAMQVIDTVQGVRNVTEVYYTHKSVKSLMNQDPIFRGYDSILISTQIQPRKPEPGLQSIFTQALAVAAQDHATVFNAPLSVCTEQNRCAGRVMHIQFREADYGTNIVTRLSMGGQLRGTTSFIDGDTLTILHEKQTENTDDYSALAEQVSAGLFVTMVSSYPMQNEEDAKKVESRLNAKRFLRPDFINALTGKR
tara:strand:+ start:763 stop:1503 length:741 start_codon:yes stop_codon:yes gene_type:complete